ncbi:hypothetical protein ASPZODRAFT_73872 [Penicilliopsis zonata CBS 506.65]|uniref:Zn(2)-C6 fungal-type domain-containing protein n=1 Tax=Penicilliopsis zonata CBS 506.65 TaxID=1073090 RepID=A0A1L9S8T6_9EURO|nr:hypothetical protein ASPZODRAFT_73872 [Penicilliopsis zonata CBS 506.65]OJJ43582.1 hypothetical protein ASPZODRAFT_73872 [Penicilliopsis zonata CBS 506.65]
MARQACDECRRRKLRCDGQQPQCSVCRETETRCQVTTQRGVRGPKRGHLKALKERLGHLEALLEGNTDVESTSTSSTATATEGIPSALPLTNLIQAELDQLYLDRVHPSIPILHQRRYLAWSRSNNGKTPSRRCLQYAMWTLAALLSAQFRELIEPLYRETKQMLEYLSQDSNETDSRELAQAWVLVVVFESMRTYHRKAWMSAGQAFRLVQAMRYHEIDKIDKKGETTDDIEVEERRRVFWMAYFLDHLISIRDDWPITLNEHIICTRLPAPDEVFQSGRHDPGPFLSEAMTEKSLTVRSAFNECLILATICGRGLLQSQQYHISKAYGDITPDCEVQRQWLDGLLMNRLEIMHSYPSPNEIYDPLLLFANILGQATVVYFCKTRSAQTDHRALEASTNIIRLAATLQDLPFSKIHPLMPLPLFLTAEFLYEHMQEEPFQRRIQELFYIFRELRNVNNHEQSYLDLLPKSCISKTVDLFTAVE